MIGATPLHAALAQPDGCLKCHLSFMLCLLSGPRVPPFSCLACLQVTDGAAAVLMMTRREAHQRQLPILGIFRSFAAVGVDPAIMGVGPAVAIPEAVKQAGLSIDDIDLFELNEAFASQVCWPYVMAVRLQGACCSPPYMSYVLA